MTNPLPTLQLASPLKELEPLLSEVLLGNTVRDWVTALLVVLLGVLAARLVRSRLVEVFQRVTSLTDTQLDDRLVTGSVGPAASLLVVASFHVAVAILEMPAGLRSMLERALIIAAALMLTTMVLRAIDALFSEVVVPWASRADGEVDAQLIRYGRFLLKLVVVATLVVMVLERVGLNVMSLVTGLGIGGMAVALAAQETLGNVLGSVQIMTDRPFSAGDWVRVGDHMGIVQDIGLRSTKIMSRGRIMVVIPNKAIAEADVLNLSVGGDLAVELSLGLVYGTTADGVDRAVDIVKEILDARGDVGGTHLVHFLDYGDFALGIRVTYYVKDLARYWDVQHEVNLEIKRRFDAEGLDFAFPTQTIHLEQ